MGDLLKNLSLILVILLMLLNDNIKVVMAHNYFNTCQVLTDMVSGNYTFMCLKVFEGRVILEAKLLVTHRHTHQQRNV